ncbi:DUF2079 domain-containing protein [Candidatus Woesearchaeota archaeon]|nr:DUF2079 domain-containing protein [Candidatus Woesearchaeota archaeon]
MELTKLHIALSAIIVAAAAMAVNTAAYGNESIAPIAGTMALAWLSYSALAAKLAARDFTAAFQKALFLDSLTYAPMLLLPLAKLYAPISTQAAAIPAALALGIAIAANIAGKIIFLPKNIDAQLDNAFLNRRIKLAVAAAIALYFIFFASITVMKHASFNSTAFDLAIFDQTTWGYSQGYGPGFFNTVRGLALLGDHLHPILFIFSPLYKFLPMPEALLVLQSLALAIGALPVYWLAKKRLNPVSAAAIAVSYLLYPSLQYINLFDFHPEAFATPLLLFAIYFADARKYFSAAVMLALAGLSKEHMPLAFVSIGIYVFLLHKKRLAGMLMAATGAIWLFANFKLLLPHFSGGQAYGYISWFSYLGSSLPEIAKNALLHPQLIIGHALAPDKIVYLALLFLPLGAAIMIATGLPYLLMAAPFFTINLLRSQNLTTAALYQYNAELIPFIYFAAIIGMQNLMRLLKLLKLSNTKAAVAAFVGLTTAAALVAYGPFATIYDVKDFVPSQHTKAGKLLLKEIPAYAAVSADPFLLPHLTHRKEAYMFPNPFSNLMFGSKEPQPYPEYVVLDLSRASPTYNAEQYAKFLSEFLNNGDYGLAKLEDSYALFRKGGNYRDGICKLNTLFTTSTSAAMKINLGTALNEENRIILKQC